MSVFRVALRENVELFFFFFLPNIGHVAGEEKHQSTIVKGRHPLKGPSMLAELSCIPQTRYQKDSLRSFHLNLNNRLWLGFVSPPRLRLLVQALPSLTKTQYPAPLPFVFRDWHEDRGCFEAKLPELLITNLLVYTV